MEFWKTPAIWEGHLKNVHCNIVHNHNSHPMSNLTVVNFCEGCVCVHVCEVWDKGRQKMNITRIFLLPITCPVNHCLTATITMPARNNIVHCSRSIVTKKTDFVPPKESTPLLYKSSVVISSRSRSNMDSICLLCYFLLGNIRTLLSFISQKHKSS